MKVKWGKLVTAIGITQGAGVVGSIATVSSVKSWYQTVNKPWFTPPNWVFGPVWTILFLLMGVGLYLVWERKKNRKALIIFGIQLGLNILWSFLFFGLRSPVLGLIEIIALWIAIAMTIREFWRLSKPAGWLLVPYLAWVTLATGLNFEVWRLN